MGKYIYFGLLAAFVLAWSSGHAEAAKKGMTAKEMVAKILAAAPEKPVAKPEKSRKMLVFNLCCGFKHASIPTGAKAMEILGAKTGAWETAESSDPDALTAENLKKYDAVCLNKTTKLGEKMTKAQAGALKDFISGGGGLVGIHAATDNFYKLPELAEIMGGLFHGHPWNEEVTIKVEEPDHPICRVLGTDSLTLTDEIYQFKDPYSRKRLRVLLSIDTEKTDMDKGGKIKRDDDDFAVSWIRTYGKGRVFYCSLGHRHDVFWNPKVLKFYLAGIQYAMGDLAADAAPSASSAAEPYRVDPFVGEYQGTFRTAEGKETDAAGQVFAQGDDKYKVLLLPGQNVGDGVKLGKKSRVIELTGHAEKGAEEVEITGGGFRGTLSSEAISAEGDDGKFELNYTVRKSSALRAKPPKGATVLLPYEPGRKTSLDAWKNRKWKILSDGSVEVNGGSNFTNENFGSAKLHVEFRIPYEPKRRGQKRGNSGVYVQGRYEVQVLDSFGLAPKKGDCGAIYGVKVPDVNASLPPGRWQSYDIEFHAPVTDDSKVVKPATITVQHNGITIHKDVNIPSPTGAAKFKKAGPDGPLMLQDHGHPVRFRNIWLVELED